MTVDELRETLLRAKRDADDTFGPELAPDGLEEAIVALPDLTLVETSARRVPQIHRASAGEVR